MFKPDRTEEVEKHLDALGVSVDERMLCLLVKKLSKHERTGGCLSAGGSSVKDWIRMELNDAGYFPCGRIDSGCEHVVGVLHFWSWDEDRYGPSPKNEDTKNKESETARSPLMRLVDAEPIDATALKVARKKRKAK